MTVQRRSDNIQAQRKKEREEEERCIEEQKVLLEEQRKKEEVELVKQFYFIKLFDRAIKCSDTLICFTKRKLESKSWKRKSVKNRRKSNVKKQQQLPQ